MTPLERARNSEKERAKSCISCAHLVEIRGVYYCEVNGKILLPRFMNIGHCMHEKSEYKENLEEKNDMKYKKLLLVEDGSVDVEKITEDLKDEPIYIIVYRQGAKMPEIVDLTSEYEGEKSPAIGFEVESERDEENKI
jgi:hypothetical protein